MNLEKPATKRVAFSKDYLPGELARPSVTPSELQALPGELAGPSVTPSELQAWFGYYTDKV